MTDARNNRICPIFRTADVDGVIGGETRSFLEAHKWFEEGRKVSVIFNGELIGEMRMGEPIDGLDDIYKLNPNEPYGTIHYAKEQHSYYINLPDRLLTPEEVVYIPTPIDTADVVLPDDVQSLIENLQKIPTRCGRRTARNRAGLMELNAMTQKRKPLVCFRMICSMTPRRSMTELPHTKPLL